MLDSAELRVLSFVLASRLPSEATGAVVISKKPSVESFFLPDVAAYEKFRVFERFPALTEETVLDLLAKESQPDEFDGLPELPRPSVFLDAMDQRALFRGGADWVHFYEAYPDSGGIFYLSRVGFNRARDQAIVHVGHQWQGRAGGGSLVFLTVDDGVATQVGVMNTWKS